MDFSNTDKKPVSHEAKTPAQAMAEKVILFGGGVLVLFGMLYYFAGVSPLQRVAYLLFVGTTEIPARYANQAHFSSRPSIQAQHQMSHFSESDGSK